MPNNQEAIQKVPLESLKDPFYEGSVQRLYAIPEQPDYMVTETTAGGSVFDVGTIFSIEGSDVARAVFRHVLYSNLSKPETWEEVKELTGEKDQQDEVIAEHDSVLERDEETTA